MKEHFNISGMTCINCQNIIKKNLDNMLGVISANVSYTRGSVNISYDCEKTSINKIYNTIEKLGYRVSTNNTKEKNSVAQAVGFVVIIIILYFLISKFNFASSLPLAREGMGYGMIFLIGLLTSVHCIAMCGGINLSQCIPQSSGNPLRASSLYNIGRVISYTVVGFIVGALGSVVTLNGAFKGIIQIIAGIFMVIMGVNMLGIFPWLRKITPRMPSFISRKIGIEKSRSNSPLIVGLLNGLMPCGPLQAMQIYALSTGSPVKGAVSMLLFSLGTVPLMFGLGALSSLLTKKFTHKVMTVGAIFVTVLGLTMFNQGAALSGFSSDVLPRRSMNRLETVNDENNGIVDGVQYINSTLRPGGYPQITVQQGIPVRWIIDAPEGSINGCNNRIYIPEYGIEHSFVQGENIIEFMPDNIGRFQYSCWMGMIRSTITVVEQGADTTLQDDIVEEEPNVVLPSCCR